MRNLHLFCVQISRTIVFSALVWGVRLLQQRTTKIPKMLSERFEPS